MKRKVIGNPTVEQLEAELRRERHKRNYKATLRSTVSALMIVAAIAVLISMLWIPVLQVVGESMTPSLFEGEIIVAPKGLKFQKGDVIAFYYNNKILVKRVIAGRALCRREGAGRLQHHAAVSGARREDLRDGRSQGDELRQPQHGGGMRRGGADRRKGAPKGLAL